MGLDLYYGAAQEKENVDSRPLNRGFEGLCLVIPNTNLDTASIKR